MGYKWSILNNSDIKTYLFHPLLELGEFHFPIIGPRCAQLVSTVLRPSNNRFTIKDRAPGRNSNGRTRTRGIAEGSGCALSVPAFTPEPRTLPRPRMIARHSHRRLDSRRTMPQISLPSLRLPIARKGRKLSCDVNVGNLSVTRGSRCPHPHHVDTKALCPLPLQRLPSSSGALVSIHYRVSIEKDSSLL